MVKELVIDGKSYPVRVSYYALKKTKEATGRSLSGIKDDDYEIYEELLYHALVSGAKAEKKEVPFSKGDMENVLDDCFMQFVKLIPSFFPTGETEAPKKGEEKKKEEPIEKK